AVHFDLLICGRATGALGARTDAPCLRGPRGRRRHCRRQRRWPLGPTLPPSKRAKSMMSEEWKTRRGLSARWLARAGTEGAGEPVRPPAKTTLRAYTGLLTLSASQSDADKLQTRITSTASTPFSMAMPAVSRTHSK